MTKKPEYIIVLSAERKDESGRFPNFGPDKKDPSRTIYIGGEVRMQATLKAAKLYPDAEFVMVGGFDQIGQETFSKAQEMADFVRESFPDLNLKVIDSLPSTRSNLVALFNILGGQIQTSNFVLLTSDDRVVRIAEFWKRLKETDYPGIPEPEFLTVKQLGIKEATAENSPEYLLRLQREREGIDALRSRNYKNSESERFNRDCLPNDVDLETLFTPRELNKMNFRTEIKMR